MTNDDEQIEKEDAVRSAKAYADFLTGRGNVRRVGLFGSVARGEGDPNDIDIALFLENDKALEFLEVMPLDVECEQFKAWMKTLPAGSQHDFHDFIQMYIMGLSEQENMAMRQHSFERHLADAKHISFLNISDNPTREYLERNIKEQRDPGFFDDFLRDVLIYDPESKEFIKKAPWPEEINEMIKEIAFNRLKELTTGEDEDNHLDWIEQNPRREG